MKLPNCSYIANLRGDLDYGFQTQTMRQCKKHYDSYRLAMQNRYDADAFLPGDFYVFDSSMTWCVVFTHETTDWESELDNPMKAAESRVCIICGN